MSCMLWAGGVAAQTISQSNADGTLGDNNSGQSFTATMTGQVTAIAVASRAGGTFTLRLYNGGNGTGILGNPGTPVLPLQTVTLPASALPAAPLTVITLATPLPVVAGSQYTFNIEGSWKPLMANVGGYAGGQAVADYGLSDAAIDLKFDVYETAAVAPVASPSPIPSSSEWSLIGAALLILAAALFHRHRFGRTHQLR